MGIQAAAGNSTYQLEYQYEDQQPLSGTAWYRLRQVDLDGTFAYSQIVEIKREPTNVSVYPNPVQEVLHLAFEGKEAVRGSVLNIQGHVMVQQQLETGNPDLDVRDLPAGIYPIRMSNGEGPPDCERIGGIPIKWPRG